MNGTFNLNQFVQETTMRQQWHQQEAAKAKAGILQLEQQLEGLYEARARHEGAAGGLAESLKAIQNLLGQPGNPIADPLAASDQ